MISLQYLAAQVDRVIGYTPPTTPSHSRRASALGLMVGPNPDTTVESSGEQALEGDDQNDEHTEETATELFSSNLRKLRSYKSHQGLGTSTINDPVSVSDEGTSGSKFDSSSSPEIEGKEADDPLPAQSSLRSREKSGKFSPRTIFVIIAKILYLFIPDTRLNPLTYLWHSSNWRSSSASSSSSSSSPSSSEKTPIEETQDALHTLRQLQSPYRTTHQGQKRHPLAGMTNSSGSLPRNLQPPRPLLSKKSKKKTLVLDLDETLIHSLSRGSRFSAGQMVEVKLESQFATLYFVNKRPFCDEFLRSVSQWYKLVVFTASVQAYADPMIDWLEQERKYFSQRLYRQHCTATPNGYIKDLSKINGDLSKVIIVDNSPISYALHQDNAISVEGWLSDPTDRSLQNLVPLLYALHYTGDVRSFLSLKSGDAAFDYGD